MAKIQLVQSVLVKTDRYPTARDGTSALATLQELSNGDMPKRQAFEAAGFKQAAPDLWVHDDGSWVKGKGPSPDEFGIGTVRLSQVPSFAPAVDRSVARGSERPALKGKDWAWFQKNIALGKLTSQQLSTITNDGDAGKVVLMRAGFVVSQRRSNEETWVHPDGSWIKVDSQGNPPERGWKGYALLELQAGKHRDLVRMLQQRPRVPASMQKYAIAKIGLVNSSTVGRKCKSHGFVQIGDTWVHPDGSWVKNDQGSISVGWKGRGLDDLPYQNGSGWS